MKSRRRVIIVVIALVAVAGAVFLYFLPQPGTKTFSSPSALTVNGNARAIGVDPDHLSFAWRVGDPRPGARQTAYRIIVAGNDDAATTGEDVVWDHTVRSAQQAFVAYAGPRLESGRQYWWTVQTTSVASGEGDTTPRVSGFAGAIAFVTGVRDADWRAKWIRPGPRQPGAEAYTYVRGIVRPRANRIVRATAYVAASQQYQLYVGNQQVGVGPSYGFPDRAYYQGIDITNVLTPGQQNVIGVLHYWAGPGQGRPASPPGLLVQISVDHANGLREVFGSDRTWRQHAAEWQDAPPRNDEGGFVEHIDGRLHPNRWTFPKFDARGWTPVPEIGEPGTAPFTHLMAQRTRIVQPRVNPVAVKTLPGGAVVADFGSVVAARPRVVFHDGSEGRRIEMHVGYVLDPDGHVSTTKSTQATDLSFEYVQRSGFQAFEPFQYLGFRYLEIDDPGEPVAMKQVTARVRHTEMPTVAAATFVSGDKTLDTVWQLVRRSALYASQEQFVDTPTREKGQFLADAYNISLATMHGFREQNLTWQALQDFADSQRRYWPDGNLNAVYPNGDGKRSFLDFTERYPDWLWQYYTQTGDRETLTALYPVAKRVTGYVASLVDPQTGLVTYTTEEGRDLVDWPPAMRYGYDVGTVARTTTNVLAALGFQRLAEMATLLGRDDDAAVARARRDDLVDAINAKLTRADGVYVDGVDADGSPSPHAAQQASAFALAAGIVPQENVDRVGAYVADLGIKTGPMDGLFLLDALRAAGRTADVVRVLTDTEQPGWAYETTHGGTFTWESWTPSDVEGDSMSHGWGSSALVAFQTALLGVSTEPMRAAAAGPVVNVVAPPAGPERVSGQVPTIAGAVKVTWKRAGGRLTLDLVVPANATARVVIGGRERTVGAGHHELTS